MTGFIQNCIELARLEQEKLDLRKKEETRKFADEVRSTFSSRFQVSPLEFTVIPETSGMATIEIEDVQLKAIRKRGSIEFKLIRTCKNCGKRYWEEYENIFGRQELGFKLLRSDEWICEDCRRQQFFQIRESDDERVLREFVERFILPYIPCEEV